MIRKIIIAILCCALFSCTDMAEKTVRTGKLDACPNQTVESLINGKVLNTNWENFISKETNEYIVGVRGQISILGEVSPIHVQFAVDDDRFEIRFLEIDKEAQDIDGINEFINYLCGFYDQGLSEIQNSSDSELAGQDNQPSQSADINSQEIINETSGVYLFEDESCSISFLISDDSWQSEFTIKTGLGSEYDSENTEYDIGLVQGNSLYEESGNIEIGKISNGTITTTLGEKYVVLKKIQS
jgi:hypothetical protein